MNPETESSVEGEMGEGRSSFEKASIYVGIAALFVVILNLFYGLGNFFAGCAEELHSTCSSSMKLNWLDFHHMGHWEAWSPVSSVGMTDIARSLISIALISTGVFGVNSTKSYVQLKIRGIIDYPFVQRTTRRVRDTPDNLRLAVLGAWRARERGMAVFAGVFLSSLVITTVLAYGVGLSQAFFEGFLEVNVFDAKVEFNKEPSYENLDGWSNNTSHLLEVCDEFTEMEEFSDCTVVMGKKGLHSSLDWGNENVFNAVPLMMQNVNSTDSERTWDTDGIWNYEYTTGPPVASNRAIALLGPGAFDGVIADRISENIIYERGEWEVAADVESQRGVYIPSDIASLANAEVGDNLSSLNFTYTSETAYPGQMDDEDCDGEILIVAETGFMHCQHIISVENMTVLGVYEPWPQSNPTLAANPIYTTCLLYTSPSPRD